MPPHSDHDYDVKFSRSHSPSRSEKWNQVIPKTSDSRYGTLIDNWIKNPRDLVCSNIRAPPNSERFCSNVPTEIQQWQVRAIKKWREPRNVTFFPEVEIIEIPNVRELPSSAIRALYMSREEMSSIHQECWEIVDLMNLGIEYDEQEYFSKRGLVDLKEESVERRRRIRQQAYKVVFGVQAYQQTGSGRKRTPCIDMAQVLADLYHKTAIQAQNEAYRTGHYDAIAAGTA